MAFWTGVALSWIFPAFWTTIHLSKALLPYPKSKEYNQNIKKTFNSLQLFKGFFLNQLSFALESDSFGQTFVEELPQTDSIGFSIAQQSFAP